MVKHTQTIHRQQPSNCLSVFDRFVKLALKLLNKNVYIMYAHLPGYFLGGGGRGGGLIHNFNLLFDFFSFIHLL